jgi:hypothetical protein
MIHHKAKQAKDTMKTGRSDDMISRKAITPPKATNPTKTSGSIGKNGVIRKDDTVKSSKIQKVGYGKDGGIDSQGDKGIMHKQPFSKRPK